MKTLRINLQTMLFLAETTDTVIAAVNCNKNMLVYNPQMLKMYNINISDIIEELKIEDIEVKNTYKTDSFGINFYDHKSGGTSEFHEVEGEPI